MTEAEWLACDDPLVMIDHIGGKVSDRKVSDRKLRLFACACARLVWHLLDDTRSRDAVEVAERFADGLATGDDLDTAWRLACCASGNVPRGVTWKATSNPAFHAARMVSWDPIGVSNARSQKDELARCAVLLRDIVGNPFSPFEEIRPRRGGLIMLDAWYGGVYHFPEQPALVMARTVYEQRLPDGRLDPVLLSVLADALEDHDLHPDLLEVLRSPGPHYRGLWPVDLILGKE